MNRKVLLIEPNYKNKYPPMGLMKIATYFRRCGDDVRFFKGDLKQLAARILCEEFYTEEMCIRDSSCTSSKIIRCFSGMIFLPLISPSNSMIL